MAATVAARPAHGCAQATAPSQAVCWQAQAMSAHVHDFLGAIRTWTAGMDHGTPGLPITLGTLTEAELQRLAACVRRSKWSADATQAGVIANHLDLPQRR